MKRKRDRGRLIESGDEIPTMKDPEMEMNALASDEVFM